MKIVLITKYFIPDNSVDSTSSMELINALLNRNPLLNIHVVTTNSNYKNIFKVNGSLSSAYTVHQIKSLYSGKSKILLFITGLIDGLRMVLKARSLNIKSIITLTNPPLISIWCALLLKKKQWFYWTFDLFPDALFASGIISENNLLFQSINNFVYRNSPSVLITLGEKQYNYLKNKYKKKIPNIILPCGIFETSSNSDILLPEWYKSNHKYLGYVGNLGMAHSKDFLISIIQNIYLLKDYTLILALYGDNKVEIEDYIINNNFTNIILVERVEKQHLYLIDIHLVSILDKWTHISVPSKAVSAVCSGGILMFYGSRDSDTWTMFKECSFWVEDLKSIPDVLKSISPSVIKSKGDIARTIAYRLLSQQKEAYDHLAQSLFGLF